MSLASWGAMLPKMLTEAIGWLSSLVLLATLAKQVVKQWRAQRAEGVSRWLFVGQLAASLGFTLYSALVHNWVFVVTNALLVVNACAGLVVDKKIRRNIARRAALA